MQRQVTGRSNRKTGCLIAGLDDLVQDWFSVILLTIYVAVSLPKMAKPRTGVAVACATYVEAMVAVQKTQVPIANAAPSTSLGITQRTTWPYDTPLTNKRSQKAPPAADHGTSGSLLTLLTVL